MVEDQRRNRGAEFFEARVVQRVKFGVGFAVTPDVRQTVRCLRIRPEIGGHARVIVKVPARRRRLLGCYGERFEAEPAVRFGFQAGQRRRGRRQVAADLLPDCPGHQQRFGEEGGTAVRRRFFHADRSFPAVASPVQHITSAALFNPCAGFPTGKPAAYSAY